MRLQETIQEKKNVIDWLRRLGDNFYTSLIVIDPEEEDMPIAYANEAFSRMSGYLPEELIGRNGRFLHGERTDVQTAEALRETLNQRKTGTFEILNYRKNGLPYWNEMTIQPVTGSDRQVLYLLLIIKDITARKQNETLIHLQEEIFDGVEKRLPIHVLLQKVCDAVEPFYQTGTACSILLIDDGGCFQFGADASLPLSLRKVIEGMEAGPKTGTCGAAYHRKEIVITECINTDPLWEVARTAAVESPFASCWSVPIITSTQQVLGTFGLYFPIHKPAKPEDLSFLQQIAPLVAMTLRYWEQQKEMLRLAYVDVETNLPNHHYFRNELADLLKEDAEGVVVFITAPEYINIVDQYGHATGDELIGQMGNRLSKLSLSAHDCVARFSGSTLAFSAPLPAERVPECLEQIKQALVEPADVADLNLFLTVKMGVALITRRKQEAEELIRAADSALTKAKTRPGEATVYFNQHENQALLEELKLANELMPALIREEVEIHLQPKVDLKTGELTGFEALARWYSKELGHVPPSVFIPAAEKNGKIRLLEQQVLKQVLSWLKSRKERGLALYPVAVNISADHFFHWSFPEDLINMVRVYGIEPELLRLEITESIGFTDFEAARKVFRQIGEYGFTSSVDDFGTGYSSLSYLQKLPVSEIKIDRSFIMNLHEKGTEAIVRTIVQLADNLNMTPVAEGVETEEQRQKLIAIGCQIGQGYYFYRPMPVDQADRL